MEKIIQRVHRKYLILLLLVFILCVCMGFSFNNKKEEINNTEENNTTITIEIKKQHANNTEIESNNETNTEDKKEKKKYTDEDLYWLSRIVSAEAKGEPIEGQIAVANVVLNRVASNQFPDTIKEVVFQEGQFSPVTDKSIYEEPTNEAIDSAKKALEGVSVVDENVFFFYNPNIVKSSWLDTREVAVTIGNHTFTY